MPSGLNLKLMLEHRQGHPLMRERDFGYEVFDAYINSRGNRAGKEGGLPQLTYKPFASARFKSAAPKDHKLAINLSRKVHSYFTSTFSKVPSAWKIPRDLEQESEDAAERLSFWFAGVLQLSRMGAAQPRAASWLSNRGDTVYSVDWDRGKKEIYVRTWDPQWCYPTASAFDVGGVEDMLISFTAPRKWCQENYKVQLKPSSSPDTAVYLYWDRKMSAVQISNGDGEGAVVEAGEFFREHSLGVCPFRWVFGNADGMYAQSDIRDVPSLQDFYNENLLLAMDSIRKQVDASWLGFGIKKDITPIPGTVKNVANADAKVQRLEAGAEPQVIMAVMEMLDSGIESQTGISPASSRGQIRGTSSGVGVRNQVHAIEARNEARKSAFEDVFSQLGALALLTLEKEFGDKGVQVQAIGARKEVSKNGYIEVTGKDVDGHYLFLAQYGGFLGASLAERIQASLQGLGRLYDLREAIKLAELPGVNPMQMEKAVGAYQETLAIQAARAQSLAQNVGQAMQGKQPSPEQMGQPPMNPAAMPQRAQPAPAPSPQDSGLTTLGDIERTLQVLHGKLHGSVWAVGELAVAGVAAAPLLMVGSEQDLGPVSQLMQALHTSVLPGHPGEMPNLLVA